MIIDSNYFGDAPNIVTSLHWSFVRTAFTMVYNNEIRTEDTEFKINSDIEYITDAGEYLKLSKNKVVSIPFNLSSSKSGTTLVTYHLDGTQPSWVYIDSVTGLVTADTSQATIGDQYVFGVLTAIVPSTWTHSSTQVTISVVG